MSKVALVTGGARRLGRAIVIGLAKEGYDVVLTYHTSDGPAREVALEVLNLGRRAWPAQVDLGVASEIEALVDKVREDAGRLDLVVNSAATFDAAPLADIDADRWDAVMDVNLRSPFLLVRGTAGLLEKSAGSVVNIVDLSAIRAWTERPHHAVSKAGLLHMTRVLARLLAPNVRVNAIAPGAVLPPNDYDPERLERLAKRAPLGRLGDPEDVVRTVLFLAGSPFITGEMILVDGGRHLT